MLLFGATAWLLSEQTANRPDLKALVETSAQKWRVRALNLTCGILVAWLAVSGLATGLSRYYGASVPNWVVGTRWVFPVVGSAAVASLVAVLWPWVRVAAGLAVFDTARRRAT